MTRAVIFDMNGVIINDELIHQASWPEFCRQHGIAVSEENMVTNVFGRTEEEAFNFVFQRELSEAEVAQYSAERVEIAKRLFHSGTGLNPGLGELLQSLHQRAIPLAIATSGRVPYTNFVLDTFGIRHFFQAVVTAEDVENGKPDPEVYLKAAQRLAVSPQGCVAIEDSPTGIAAAKAASMYVVGISTTYPAARLSQADEQISSFIDLDVDHLLSVVSE